MTQATTQPSNQEPDFDIDASEIFEKKQKKLEELNSEEKYVIKAFKDGKIEDAYEGVLDFTTPEGKAEFNFLQKLIAKNNWLVIPDTLFTQFETDAISLENLEEATTKNHEKLSLPKPNFNFIQAAKVNDDFISQAQDVGAAPEVKDLTQTNNNVQVPTGIANGEAVALKPSEILSSFDISVNNKLNELKYHKNRLEKTKGKVSIKSLGIVGGVFAVGVVFSPLAVLTTSAAIAIGGYAILKGMFSQSPDIKNYDKQIDILKEATANMVLKRTGDDSKKNVTHFVKNNKSLSNTLFDDKIEAEFARICKVRNVRISSDIFKKAHTFEDGHIIDYNRESKNNKP